MHLVKLTKILANILLKLNKNTRATLKLNFEFQPSDLEMLKVKK